MRLDYTQQGKRFGRLVLLGPVFSMPVPYFARFVVAKCDCGIVKCIGFAGIRNGGVVSCGCNRRERAVENRVASNKSRAVHNATGTRLYGVWRGIKERCRDPRITNYNRYGARGIDVCDEWFNSFVTFREWALSSGYGFNLQIDRINNDGNYEPSNCRWVTVKVNSRNKSTNRIVVAFGEAKCVAEWVDDPRCSVTGAVVLRRLDRNWPAEKAISQQARAYLGDR